MPQPTKNYKEIQYLPCPHCHGEGVIGDKICPECRQLGLVAWSGNHLLYWGKIIDSLYILQNRVIKTGNNIINFILMIVGLIGFGMFFWHLTLLPKTLNTLWNFWQIASWQAVIFWLTVITDSFLIFRYSQEYSSFSSIPKKILAVGKFPYRHKINWYDIKTLKAEQRIDISQLYSQPSLQAVEKSWELAKGYNHYQITPIHLFTALFSFNEIINIFVRLGISFELLKSKIGHALAAYSVPTEKKIYYTPEFQKILFDAYFEAWQNNQKKVELADLLLILAKNSKIISNILYDLKIDMDKIKNVTLWIKIRKTLKSDYLRFRSKASLRPKSSINRSMTAVATPFLDSFSQDLTQMAQLGYLEPCIGREKEIKDIFRITQSSSRQSVVLVGNPGVGKRTIINGIAQMMVSEDVPPIFQDKRLVSLSVAKLISGVDASEAAQRLLIVINEILRSGNIILVISDISKIVGISPGGPGSLDLAGVLSQALSRKQLIVISTALPSDYTRYVENQSSLYQVLEKVNIEEVQGNEAIQILEAKSSLIEYHYNVFFSYDAIVKVVALAERYIHDRYLPEKAIEILEETAIRVYNDRGRDATITEQDIAQLVSEKVEIPLTEITQAETDKLLNLEKEIHNRIINQEEAVRMVAAAIRRARAELRDIKRPIVNLLFLGPTGVGKTELAKTVTKVYFGKDSEMIRLDMSEYQEKSSINRLIGAPIGFAGGGEGGYLTENVRKNPFALLLLDEIEKAHPDILNIFLQVMDDGRLTDSQGRTIDFTNAIIIATSNACTPIIQKRVREGMSASQIKNQLMEGELQQYFRPEFLNRFDGIIVFKPLTMDNVRNITKLMLTEVAKKLEAKGIILKPTEAAIEELSILGYDPDFGARPLRRVIQERVDDILANYILNRKFQRRDVVIFDVGGKIDIIRPKDD